MKIFITGAAGFIGSKLAKSLVIRGHDVLGYDIFHRQVHGIIPFKEFGFRII